MIKVIAAKLVINFKREVMSFSVLPLFQTLCLQLPVVSVSFVSISWKKVAKK